MIKRALAAALCLMLVFALLPKTALADGEVVWIEGFALTAATPYYHNGKDGKGGKADNVAADYNAYYDESAGTLYLNDLNVTNSTAITTDGNGNELIYAIYIKRNLTLDLGGSSTVSTGVNIRNANCAVFSANGYTLTVTGSGTLTAIGNKSAMYTCGVLAYALSMEGGAIHGTAGEGLARSYGVSANTIDMIGGSITGTGGKMSGTGESSGVCAGVSITMNGGSITGTGGTVQSAGSRSCGVCALQGILVEDGTIVGTGGLANGANSDSYGVCALEHGKSIIANGGSITGTGGEATARNSVGVYVNGGYVKVEGGSITGTGGKAENSSYGVYADGGHTDTRVGNITCRGGEAKANSCGVYASTVSVSDKGSLTSLGGKADSTNGLSCGAKVDTNIVMSGSAYVHCAGGTGATSYGIFDEDIAWSIVHSLTAVVLVQGHTMAFNIDTNGNYNTAAAGYKYDGSDAVALGSHMASLSGYRYFRAPYVIPATQFDITPEPSFPFGQAPADETVTITSNLTKFNASNSFDKATMDGVAIDLGSVGVPGAQGSVKNGSIVIDLNKAYLNTLSAGTHTLRVYLAGQYAGQVVETQITVLPSGGGIGAGGDVGPDVPKTGDAATPALWLGLMLLAGAGLAVSAVRRKRQNG